GDLRLTERIHAFFECPNNREWNSLNRKLLSHRVISAAKHLARKWNRDIRAHHMCILILFIEESPREHNEISHVLVLGAHTENQRVFDYAASETDAIVRLQNWG